MLIIGIQFFTWGSALTASPFRCGRCGHMGSFVAKKGMRFLTIFFVIPVIPLSGVHHPMECPQCGTRYATVRSAIAA